MASVEDLVSGLSGGVHVSQDGYELKALQEYLRQTITIPNIISTSPVNYTSRPQPASRSTSTTRKHNSFPQSLLNDTSSQPYPSPSINSHGNTSFFHSAEDISTTGQISRPTALRRTSSYGFGGSKEHPITASSSALPAPSPAIDSGFEYDAFAPMYQQPPNSWNGTSHQQASGSSNPWSAFSGQSSAFGQLQQSQSQFTQFAPQSEKFGSFANRPSQVSERVVPVEEEADFGYDDDDMMDEDRAEDGIIDDMDEEDRVEMVMGLSSGEEDRRYQYGYGGWDRGRQ